MLCVHFNTLTGIPLRLGSSDKGLGWPNENQVRNNKRGGGGGICSLRGKKGLEGIKCV